MSDKKVMIISDDYMGQTAYSKISTILADGLTEKYDVYYVCQSFGMSPTQVQQITSSNVKILPQHYPQQTKEHVIQIGAYINLYHPDYVIIIGDPVVREAFDNIQLIEFKNERIKKIFYTFIDSYNLPSRSMNILNKMDFVIPATNFAKVMLKQEELKPEILGVLYPPVNNELFKPLSKKEKVGARKKYKISNNDFIVFNYGRLTPRKNPYKALEVAMRVILQQPEIKFVFQFVELHTDVMIDLKDYMDRILPIRLNYDKEKIRWEDSILINTTYVSDEELVGIIGMSDLGISISSGEGFNYIIPECLFCEVPLLLSNNSTATEVSFYCVDLIDANEEVDIFFGGRHYNSNTSDIVEKILFIYRNKSYYNDLKKKAKEYRKINKNVFNKKLFVNKFIEVLENETKNKG